MGGVLRDGVAAVSAEITKLTADTITDEQIREVPERKGCCDLDPNWPGLGGRPRGPVLCVSYPRCSCGRSDRARCAEILNARAKEHR